MRTYKLKRLSIPKVAVLATALAAGAMVATVDMRPAQAWPTQASGSCAGCHTAGGSVTATPSSATVAPGAAYTVALVFTGGTSPVGYNITGNGEPAVTGSTAGPANMTAPAAAGTYTYTVWMRAGVVASTTYSITVGAAPTTTTAPPTSTSTTAPPTSTSTTVPPTSTSTTVPPTSTSTTAPPSSTTTTPPPSSTTTTPPPSSIAHIRKLSPDKARVGARVTIRGTGFGTSGTVKFGSVVASASTWTNKAIVVRVPAGLTSEEVMVTVTPLGGTASNGVEFEVKGRHHHNDSPRYAARLGGDFA